VTREPLTRQRILDAALILADASGLEALTMRKVGEALGVEAMSLYNHIDGKETLLDGLVDQVFSEIELPPPGQPWKNALRSRAVSARQALLRHPWATPLMSSRARSGPATLRHHNAVLGCLRSAGLSLVMAAHAVSVIDGYLYGFTMQQRALPFQTAEEAAAVAASLMAAFPMAEFPYLGEMMRDHVLKPGYDYADEFVFGLDLILDGLETRRRSEVSSTR
jgi:AcrR family transcriptional regulator